MLKSAGAAFVDLKCNKDSNVGDPCWLFILRRSDPEMESLRIEASCESCACSKCCQWHGQRTMEKN